MPTFILAPTLAPWVALFSDCFTQPTFRTFQVLLTGWLLCLGRHTVTGVLLASGAVGGKHHSSFHRFFSQAAWCLEGLGLKLLAAVVGLLPADAPVYVALDDTLGRHTGKHIKGAAMHHDPLLSTRAKAFFHWGHVWVVLAVVVQVPSWKKSFALPVLVRLYRPEKLCRKEGRPFYKKTQLAAQLLAVLAQALPTRRIIALGDAAYMNASVVKTLPANVDFIGRGRLDAALYARPVRNRRGRPRLKGRRLPSPAARAKAQGGWWELKVEVYGRPVTVQCKVFEALWYSVAKGRPLRFVLVRGWPGHEKDDVLCCTNTGLNAQDIVRSYCLRWALEVTFEESKGKLGFEEPQNRTNPAVERTAPMALFSYTLTVLWYLTGGKDTASATVASTPWYSKTVPAFSDMLAALRREIWRERLLKAMPSAHTDEKSLEPLLHSMAYAA